jgi:hypothetical protein
MLLLTVAALTAAPLPKIIVFHDTVQPSLSTSRCLRTKAYIAGTDTRYDGKPLALRKLTELPAANMYIAVDRHDANGCGAPIIVRYDLGR